jgi:hypothetical protein
VTAQVTYYNAALHQSGIVTRHQWQINVLLLNKLISADVIASALGDVNPSTAITGRAIANNGVLMLLMWITRRAFSPSGLVG